MATKVPTLEERERQIDAAIRRDGGWRSIWVDIDGDEQVALPGRTVQRA